MKPIIVKSPDGLSIAAQEWGTEAGAEILFIHGFNQCHLSWQRQVTDGALGAEFRMVTYDLRGHGASDKPRERERYRDGQLWADDLAAVIATAGLKRPVLVGWSYAGRVISDYLRAYGDNGLAGINFVAAVTKSGSEFFGPGGKHIAGLLADDLAANIAGARGFVRACFEAQPAQDDIETMLAFNMITPPKVRAAVLDRVANPGDLLAKIKVPVLVTHGEEDALILPALGRFTASEIPGARLSLYAGIGHAPFFEDAPRFNRELAEFVRAANKRAV